MKVEDDLDFDEFLAKVGVAKMRVYSNQTECGVIYQLRSMS